MRCDLPDARHGLIRFPDANQILDPEDDPEEEEEDGGAQDIDATRQAKSAVMKTSTRQVRHLVTSSACRWQAFIVRGVLFAAVILRRIVEAMEAARAMILSMLQ